MAQLKELFPALLLSIFSMICLILTSNVKVGKRKRNKFKLTVFTSLFTIILLIGNYFIYYNIGIGYFEAYNILTIFLPQAIFVSVLSRRTILSSATASINTYLLILTIQLLKNVLYRYTDIYWTQYSQIILYPFAIVFIAKIYKPLHDEIEQVIPKLLSLILSFGIILLGEFWVYSILIESFSSYVLRLEIFGVATASIYYVAILIIYMIVKLIKNKLIETSDSKILTAQIQDLENSVKLRELKNTEIKIIRHDLKHVLSSISTMINNKEYEEAIKIIEDYNIKIENTNSIVFCKNPIINTVLESYYAICIENDIEFNIKVNDFEDILNVPAYDLGIFISNCLENAVNACKKLEANRKINFKFLNNNGRLILRVSNTYNGEIELDDRKHPISTQDGHGIGTLSMKYFADKNGLILDYDINDNLFVINVLFKDKTKKKKKRKQ